MSVIRIKEDNITLRIVTQQYEVGLYVAIYNDDTNEFMDQFGLGCTEEEYHKHLKKEYKNKIIEQN